VFSGKEESYLCVQALKHKGTKAMRKRTYGYTILDLSTRRDEWSASGPSRFTPSETARSTNWTGGWVVPEPVWTLWSRDQYLTSTGNRTESPLEMDVDFQFATKG
jgi:hypothetical protein